MKLTKILRKNAMFKKMKKNLGNHKVFTYEEGRSYENLGKFSKSGPRILGKCFNSWQYLSGLLAKWCWEI